MRNHIKNTLVLAVIILLCSCGNKNIKNSKKISFEKQLETLKSLGYKPKPDVTNEFLLNFISNELEIANPIDSIEENP